MSKSGTRRSSSSHGHGSQCHHCRKFIVWPGLCYTCATGRPRLILRPEERAGAMESLDPTADDTQATAGA